MILDRFIVRLIVLSGAGMPGCGRSPIAFADSMPQEDHDADDDGQDTSSGGEDDGNGDPTTNASMGNPGGDTGPDVPDATMSGSSATGDTVTDGNTTEQGASCGDGVRDGAEDCDGDDRGGHSCHSLGFMGGPLRCTPRCTFDTSSCHDG